MKYAAEDDDSPPLDADGILHVQYIVVTLLLYGQAVNNKVLVSFRELGQQKAADTQATHDSIMQLLDYVTTYPSDGIIF